MIYAIILFIVFSFISYRLIGIKASVKKGLVSSMLSLLFSSAAYYELHLKNQLTKNGFIQFDHYTFLYFVTLVVVSLGFTLILEMMEIKKSNIVIDTGGGPIDKFRYFIATKVRYLNLLLNITKNGLLRSTFHHGGEDRKKRVSVAFKNTLEQAGGIFVKFGQFLSTRSDLFPKSFRDELATLQENVSFIPVEQVKKIIQDQLKKPIHDIFQEFDMEPLAAASIAQVHKAKLRTGEDVVVKVLRPNLRKQLAVDINILANFSELLANRAAWARRIGIVSLTEGFIQNLNEEIDFSVELNNLKQMKKLPDSRVQMPKTFDKYSTSDVLVMEYFEGVSINKMDTVIKADEQQNEVINDIFQEMFTQIFDHGLFHGDPHPGNIFLLKDGQPAFIDFGSVGRLSLIQRNGFKWLLIGISRTNADSMVTGIKGLVENSEEIDDKHLEQALSQFLVEHNFEGNIMDEMGKELFEIMSRFGLRLYPDVAGAFRSLITLQGSLQAIKPDFNLSNMIDNYLQDQMSVKKLTHTVMENVEDDILNLVPRVRALPKRLDHIIQQIENGSITTRMSLFSDDDNVKFVNSVLALFFTGLTGFALGLLALGSLFLAQTEDVEGYSFLNIFGYAGLGLSVTMLIRVAIQSLKRRQ